MPDKTDPKNDGTRRFLFDDANEDILKIMERDIKEAKAQAQAKQGKDNIEISSLSDIDEIEGDGYKIKKVDDPKTDGIYLLSIMWQTRVIGIDMEEFGTPQSPSMIANCMAVLVPDDVLEDLVQSHQSMYGRPFSLGSIKHESIIGRAPDLDYGDKKGYAIESIKTSMYYKAKTPTEAYRILCEMTSKLDYRYIWNRIHVMFLRENSAMPESIISKFERTVEGSRELPPPQNPDIEGKHRV